MLNKRKKTASSNPKTLLSRLNEGYLRVHRNYERLDWITKMGDHAAQDRYEKAKLAREAFRTNEKHLGAILKTLETAKGKDKEHLEGWKLFFEKYQTPASVKPLFEKIVALEKKISKKMATRKEGFIHPKTKKFTKASRAQMQDLMFTHEDEKIRKACFVALENLALVCVDEYVKLVALRNEYAVALGYEDFYAYKLRLEEDMSKEELFALFDAIFEKTKYAFKDLRKMEEKMPGLRKPWNRGYLLAGDFTKESDQYHPFEEALTRWGESFMRMGINFQGSTIQLDLLDREGKYENGFCHWPELIHFKNGKRHTGQSNFTCNAVFGQVGSSEQAYNTLFHEGGHAAHYLNSEQTQVCFNHEYPPSSTAWAETQSMFLDSVYSSIEWTSRYAKNQAGETYPFSLFEKEVRKLYKLSPLAMNGISMVMNFERSIYEENNLTAKKVVKIAKDTYAKYRDSSVPTVTILGVPHIYSWQSACAYQGYGLAQLALVQWRAYFMKKYGYIVDNPKVGKEMKKVWALGSSVSFPECVKIATGKKLSAEPYIKAVTAPLNKRLAGAKKRIARLEKVAKRKKTIELDATIKLVHGKKTIATNKKSFEDMAAKYAQWLQTQKVKTHQ